MLGYLIIFKYDSYKILYPNILNMQIYYLTKSFYTQDLELNKDILSLSFSRENESTFSSPIFLGFSLKRPSALTLYSSHNKKDLVETFTWLKYFNKSCKVEFLQSRVLTLLFIALFKFIIKSKRFPMLLLRG